MYKKILLIITITIWHAHSKMTKRFLPSFVMECENDNISSRPLKIMSLETFAEEKKEGDVLSNAIHQMTTEEEGGECHIFVKDLKPYDRIPWIIFCQHLLRDETHLQMDDTSRDCFFARFHSTKDVPFGEYHPYLYMRDAQEYKDAYETLAYHCCKVKAYNALLLLLIEFNVKMTHPNGRECIEQLEKEGEWECLKLLGLIEDENEDCWKWWRKNGFLSSTSTTTTPTLIN